MRGLASMLTLATNGQAGNADGLTSGRRLYGRAPRVPIATVGALDFLDLANPVDAIEGERGKRIIAIHQLRRIWLKNGRKDALRKAHKCAPRASREQELFNGQSVYFRLQQEGKGPAARRKWRGPGIILGNWEAER